MKTNKNTRPSFGANRIDLWLPQSWAQLDDAERLWLFDLMRSNQHTPVAIKTMAFIHFAGIRLIERTAQGWLYSVRSGVLQWRIGWLRTWEVNYYLRMLDFITDDPRQAVQVAHIGRYTAANAELHDVPFETYLVCENLYQGYIASHKTECLHRMARLLYADKHGKEPAAERWTETQLFGVFYWWYSLKCIYSARFPHFFRRVDSAGGDVGKTPDMTTIMNAEIRALTGGDVTKEQQVFSLDAYRALTELNEKAREAKELSDRLKNRK